ncbi:MAG: hypothetical protein ABF289_07030, partial [Clostridiales bacterium]
MSKFKKISAKKASELFDLGKYLQYFDDYIYYYEDDTIIDGNMLLDYDRNGEWTGIIVNGNLEVNGCIKNYEASYGPFLFLTGNLKAKSIIAGGSDIIIKGNVILDDVMLGYNNHGKIRVNGDVRAKIVISENHNMEILGGISAIKLNDGGNLKDANYERWQTVIKDSVLNSDGNPFWEKLFEEIEIGNSIIKGEEDIEEKNNKYKEEYDDITELDENFDIEKPMDLNILLRNSKEKENKEIKENEQNEYLNEYIDDDYNIESNEEIKKNESNTIGYKSGSDEIIYDDSDKKINEDELEASMNNENEDKDIDIDIDIEYNDEVDEDIKFSVEVNEEINNKNSDENLENLEFNRSNQIIDNNYNNIIEKNELEVLNYRTNFKLNNEAVNFLNDISKGKKIKYKKWQILDKNLIFIENKFDGNKNLFEQYILYDQKEPHGTSVIGLLTNTIYLGETGEGDIFLGFLKENAEKVEIIFYNVKNSEFEFYCTDSIGNLRKINVLIDAVYTYEREGLYKGSDLYNKIKYELEQIKDKVTLPKNLKKLEELMNFTLEYKNKDKEALFLFWKSMWIVQLLKYDGTVSFEYIAEIFNLIEREPMSEDSFSDFINEIDNNTPVRHLIYSLFYLFFFKKSDQLNLLLETCKKVDSIVVISAAELIESFLKGRKKIGYVEDIFEIREEFLKYVNDPDKENKDNINDGIEDINKEKQVRIIEIDENDNEIQTDIHSDMVGYDNNEIFDEKSIELGEEKLAEIIINSTDKDDIIDLSWDFIDNNFMISKIFNSLRSDTEYLKKDFSRLDFILENSNNPKYDIEISEIIEVLLKEKSKLSSYLYSLGYSQFGEIYIKRKIIWLIMYDKENVYEFANKFNLKYLPDVGVKLLENKILNKLPKLDNIEDINSIEKIILKIDEYKYVLPKVKKRKIYEVLNKYLSLIENVVLTKKIKGKELDIFREKFVPLIVELCLNINDIKFVELINKL